MNVDACGTYFRLVKGVKVTLLSIKSFSILRTPFLAGVSNCPNSHPGDDGEGWEESGSCAVFD